MHRLERHENEHAPCNAYCVPADGLHVDLLYLSPWLIQEAGANILGVVKRGWARKGYDKEAEIVSLRLSPEAHASQYYYPKSAAARPGNTVAYLATYRLRDRGQ